MATWQHDNITFKKIFSGKFCGLQKPENSSFFKNLFCVVLFGRQDIVGRVSHTFWIFLDVKHELQRGTTKRHGKIRTFRCQLKSWYHFSSSIVEIYSNLLATQNRRHRVFQSFSLSVRVLVPQISCFRS